jgi:hypothetical protein
MLKKLGVALHPIMTIKCIVFFVLILIFIGCEAIKEHIFDTLSYRYWRFRGWL